jgi:peptide/nickel transport system ATP-binding protein
MNPATDSPRLLGVRELSTHFASPQGIVAAVDSVSFDLRRGETLGLVGESGCGKSVTALSLIRLVPPPGRIVSGSVLFEGRDLLQISEAEIRRVRGGRIGMIFQDPMTSLNPALTIGEQIAEAAREHLTLSRRAANALAVELLEKVGIPRPRLRARDYPHHFSGGMRQRAMIAMALACDPPLLVADEPTTALDVTIQAQILDLIKGLSEAFGLAVLLITHDLGIAAGMCDRVIVMYAGRIVEDGEVTELFEGPQMPYTNGLLKSIPRMESERSRSLYAIEGFPPDLADLVTGCRFAPRCPHARDVCVSQEPSLTTRSPTHLARCWGTESPGGWIHG